MGEAKLAKIFEARPVLFDFTKPKVVVGSGDHLNMSQTSQEDHSSQAVKLAIKHLVGAAYPQGMSLKESDHWELLQECCNAPETAAELTMGEVEWLRDQLDKSDLKIASSYIQWVRALGRYLKQLKGDEEDKIAAEKAEAAPAA